MLWRECGLNFSEGTCVGDPQGHLGFSYWRCKLLTQSRLVPFFTPVFVWLLPEAAGVEA